MNGGITIGQIGGIPIRLDWTWFIIFALVTLSLAGGMLPGAYPELGTGILWLLGTLTSLLFFGSVLLHELGHAYVARRNSIPVRGISLFVFGGVAQLGAEPRTPGAEFRIAIAGPIVSLALAALFGGLYLLDQHIPLLAAPSAWLAQINLILALFNLIPGFPLDGGRVLRAAIWQWSGSLQRANRVAGVTGQLTAWGFMGYGLFLILGGNLLGGVWLGLMGWFVRNASAGNVAHSTLQEQLRGVTVAQAMDRAYPQVSGKLPLDQLVQEYVLQGGQRMFVVVPNGQPGGLVTLRDVTAIPRGQWKDVTAQQVMVPWKRMRHVQPDTDVLSALHMMDEHTLAHLPVVADDGQVVGLLGREQVVQYLRVRAEVGV